MSEFLVDNTTWLAVVCGLIAVAYGAGLTIYLLKKPAGNERMQEIARAIQEGASGQRRRQSCQHKGSGVERMGSPVEDHLGDHAPRGGGVQDSPRAVPGGDVDAGRADRGSDQRDSVVRDRAVARPAGGDLRGREQTGIRARHPVELSTAGVARNDLVGIIRKRIRLGEPVDVDLTVGARVDLG